MQHHGKNEEVWNEDVVEKKEWNAIISHRILCLHTQMRFMHICYCDSRARVRAEKSASHTTSVTEVNECEKLAIKINAR